MKEEALADFDLIWLCWRGAKPTVPQLGCVVKVSDSEWTILTDEVRVAIIGKSTGLWDKLFLAQMAA